MEGRKSGRGQRVQMFFFVQAEDGIRDIGVTGVQTCALPIFDPASREQVLGALRTYTGAIVLVTHDEGAVRALDPDKVILLPDGTERSEEHTSELQSRQYLVCRLLLEKKKSTYLSLHTTSKELKC